MSASIAREFPEIVSAAFPANVPGEAVSAACAQEATGECAQLLVQLANSKPQWPALAKMGAMESMCSLAEEWTGCIPVEAFVYYLPAFMARSIYPSTPFEENLRGVLVEYLEPGRHSSDRHTRIANSLYCALTEEQIAAVEGYLGAIR